jgi:hypothetical protein
MDEAEPVPSSGSAFLAAYPAAPEAPGSPSPSPSVLGDSEETPLVLGKVPTDLERQSVAADTGSIRGFNTRRLVYFLTYSIPNQIYLFLMLCLPAFYFRRVSRVFEDAELSMEDLRRMAAASPSQWMRPEWDDRALPHPLRAFKATWDEFIESVVTEWKTLNLISALLLS